MVFQTFREVDRAPLRQWSNKLQRRALWPVSAGHLPWRAQRPIPRPNDCDGVVRSMQVVPVHGSLVMAVEG